MASETRPVTTERPRMCLTPVEFIRQTAGCTRLTPSGLCPTPPPDTTARPTLRRSVRHQRPPDTARRGGAVAAGRRDRSAPAASALRKGRRLEGAQSAAARRQSL